MSEFTTAEQKVLAFLQPSEPSTPWMHDEVFALSGEFESDHHEEALRSLEHRGLIVSRIHRHKEWALTSALEHPDYAAEADAYASLKSSVHDKAKTAGLRPRWDEGRGWGLYDGGNELVCTGSMLALDKYLTSKAA